MILAHGRGFLFCFVFFRNTHGRATVEDQIPNNDRWAGARAPQPAALRGGGGALAHATRPLPTGGGGCKPLSHAFPQLRRRTRSTTQATIGGGVRARGGSISFCYHPILILLRRRRRSEARDRSSPPQAEQGHLHHHRTCFECECPRPPLLLFKIFAPGD
jgi:hypothetical protein